MITKREIQIQGKIDMEKRQIQKDKYRGRERQRETDLVKRTRY